MQDKGIKPCIPGQKSRRTPVKYSKRRYKCRNRIEIMFGMLKEWRRIANRGGTGRRANGDPAGACLNAGLRGPPGTRFR